MRALLSGCIALVVTLCLTYTTYGKAGSLQSKSYQLTPLDLISVNLFDEPELDAESRIDGQGKINLPLIGQVTVAGKTPREAELSIALEYQKQRYLKKPQVTVFIVEYGPKEISVLGEVNQPGITTLPEEKNTISIVEAISRAGGFTRIAKSDAVKVTRTLPSGQKQTSTVNVKKLISNNSSNSDKSKAFSISLGDVIFVEQRIF